MLNLFIEIDHIFFFHKIFVYISDHNKHSQYYHPKTQHWPLILTKREQVNFPTNRIRGLDGQWWVITRKTLLLLSLLSRCRLFNHRKEEPYLLWVHMRTSVHERLLFYFYKTKINKKVKKNVNIMHINFSIIL